MRRIRRIRKQPGDDRKLDSVERVHVDEDPAGDVARHGPDPGPVTGTQVFEQDGADRIQIRHGAVVPEQNLVRVGQRIALLQRNHLAGAGKDVLDQGSARPRIAQKEDMPGGGAVHRRGGRRLGERRRALDLRGDRLDERAMRGPPGPGARAAE